MTNVKSGKKKAKPPVKEVAVPLQEPTQTPSQKRLKMAVCAALVLACIAIYGQTLSFDFVNADDGDYIVENFTIQSGLNWASIIWAFTSERALCPYPHPLTLFTHMMDCELYGLRAGGHHLTSLIFHAFNSILLFLVLVRMTGRLWPSALVAVLFAVHPLNVESVAWIAERKNLISTLFWTAALGTYAWYRQRPNPARYLAVAFMFLLGLMSKPMVVTLPFVLLLLDYWPLDQIDRTSSLGVMACRAARLVVGKSPLILLTVLFSLLTLMLTATGSYLLDFGATIPFVVRCANAMVVYVFYLAKTLWPSCLVIFYPYPTTLPVWQVAGAAVILAAITLFCLRQARRRPYLVVGWFWYLGTFVPVIGLVQSGSWSHANRFIYIPLIGIFIMVAWGAADLAAAWHVSKRSMAVASGILLIPLTVCAGVQTGHWHDSRTLFSHALAVGQENDWVLNNLAEAYMEVGRFDEALPLLEKGLGLAPQNLDILNNLGLIALRRQRYDEGKSYLKRVLELDPNYSHALNNLGKFALDQGYYAEARPLLERAVSLVPFDVDVLNNVGLLALCQRRYDEAELYLTRALNLRPRNVNVLNNLGMLALDQRRYDEAKPYLMKALALDPVNINALNNLGVLAKGQKHYDEAMDWLTKALVLDPENVNALNNLGLIAMDQGRDEEATVYLNKVLGLNPGHVSALYNLGVIAMDQKRYDEAKSRFTKVLELNPEHVNTLNNVGWCLMNQGQYEEAQQYFRKALEIDPGFTKVMINLGDALAKLGRQEEANGYFKRATELNQSRVVNKE